MTCWSRVEESLMKRSEQELEMCARRLGWTQTWRKNRWAGRTGSLTSFVKTSLDVFYSLIRVKPLQALWFGNIYGGIGWKKRCFRKTLKGQACLEACWWAVCVCVLNTFTIMRGNAVICFPPLPPLSERFSVTFSLPSFTFIAPVCSLQPSSPVLSASRLRPFGTFQAVGSYHFYRFFLAFFLCQRLSSVLVTQQFADQDTVCERKHCPGLDFRKQQERKKKEKQK